MVFYFPRPELAAQFSVKDSTDVHVEWFVLSKPANIDRPCWA